MPWTRRTTRTLLLASGALAALAPIAHAANTQTLDTAVELLKQSPGGPWDIGLNIVGGVGTPDGSKPIPLKKAVFLFPHATVNTKAFPTCDAVKLQKAPTTKTCPRASRLGSGEALVDARPFINPERATITMFNGKPKGGKPHFLFLGNAEHFEINLVIDATLQKTNGRYGYKLSMAFPDIPTLPNNPNASISKLDVDVKAFGRIRGKRVSLLQAPTSCPRGGWRFDSTFGYADGSSTSAGSTIDCVLQGRPEPIG
ncbi:MAG: hypothetical protein ACJ76V_14380 [Thermoleophilaceae bacterium]